LKVGCLDDNIIGSKTNICISGARVYYFKTVLHDWSDEKARVIFRNLIPAMKRGYSKIICEEYILPDSNAPSISCMTDMAVMVFARDWSGLVSVGLISSHLSVCKFRSFGCERMMGLELLRLSYPRLRSRVTANEFRYPTSMSSFANLRTSCIASF